MIHSKFPHLWITLLIVLWAVIPRTGLSQTYQLSEDVDHFIGILDAHRSNMDAHDVAALDELISEKPFDESPK